MDLLNKHGLKNTKTRTKIIEILSKEAPLSAEQLEEKLKSEGIKLSSIYRNLALFEENNILIRSISMDGISYFQLNDRNHKHQLICENCGKVFIIKDCPLDEIENMLEKSTGFKIRTHSFEFLGICKKCQSK